MDFFKNETPTIQSEAGRKLIAERRQRKKEEAERAQQGSMLGSFFGGEQSKPPEPTIPIEEEESSSGFSRISSIFRSNPDPTPAFQPNIRDDEFDPEADDYSDVFLGRNPTPSTHEEYGWWQRAQNRYRIFGGAQRMCGCSCKTILIITVIVVVVILLILLIVAWSNKGSFMFI